MTLIPQVQWGSPCMCEFVLKREGLNPVVKELKFTNNKLETANFNIELFNSMSKDVSPFDLKMISLFNSQKFKLVSHYLTLVQRSEGFIHSQEHIYDRHGFSNNGENPQMSDLETNGGSFECYMEFRNAVVQSALVVSAAESSHKRKNAEVGKDQCKLSRKNLIEAKEKEELVDPKGKLSFFPT